MNRLNRMTGLVLVIIGLFCACQGTAKQVDVETDLKACMQTFLSPCPP